ncbi:MAG: peptidoglycan DD-metalloendopeptidase family protein [candidate division KSB1 bacterium]|nr:peptidoglycan DD-metalloendopeptidase family protein [candidate division KSB1 bacterium]
MRDKRIKLIYFSFGGSEVKYIEISWGKLFFYASLFILAIVLIVGSGIKGFMNYFNTKELHNLSSTNISLENQLNQIQTKITEFQKKVEELESTDDEERKIAGLGEIDQDLRDVGVGGTALDYNEEAALLPYETKEDVLTTRAMIDQLERRVELLINSKDEIEKRLEADKEKLKHTPSVRPVDGGRITGRFGMRLDPFVEKIKNHLGLDIAAMTGTPVHASAAGKVVFICNSVNRKQAYGKQVVVEHGDGMKTRYAHLSKVHVRLNQFVNRWDVIGEVGKTGRATGPHLHYEVIVNAKRVNPELYILE